MKFAVLITCFNRVNKTLECLRHLYACTLPNGVAFDVWLNDDGCTDGTAEQVSKVFPAVNIVKGSGHDYWCGGMRRAWNVASNHFDYDYYLWLNDDTFLFPSALLQMIEFRERDFAIMVGCTTARGELFTTYSGRDKHGLKVNPNKKYQRVWGLNGNCVLVPRGVFKLLGNFPAYFTHALGDFDYGLRAKESGVEMYLTPEYVGECDSNNAITFWMDGSKPFISRMRNLYSPNGGPEPQIFFRYNALHYGVCRAIRVWVQQHIHVCFPSLWRHKE